MFTMKPYRVKRGQKCVGSYLVVHEGKRVNLKTQDANEARRRAVLVVRGQWPPADDDSSAARAVNAALEGAEPEDIQIPHPEMLKAPPEESATAAAPAPPPPPQVEAAEAVNGIASDPGDEIEAEARAALAEAGIDMSEVSAMLPEFLSGAHLWMQGQGCRLIVRTMKGKWPKMVTLEKEEPMRVLLGKLWSKKLEQWNVDVSGGGPGWWLLAIAAVTAFAQVGGMIAAIDEEEKTASVN